MSTTPNFAASPLIGSGTTTTADTSFSAPTNATVGVIFTAPAVGARIETIDNVSLGTSVAGALRLWLCEGTPGPAVSSASFSTTTATVTTATAHGLSTGALVTLQGAFPNEYNMKNVAITVTGATTFTYTMTTAPTTNATTVPEYSSSPATAVYHLLRDVGQITAITGSATVTPWQLSLNQIVNGDLLPLMVPPGWSLCTTVSVTQTHALKTTARGGKF